MIWLTIYTSSAPPELNIFAKSRRYHFVQMADGKFNIDTKPPLIRKLRKKDQGKFWTLQWRHNDHDSVSNRAGNSPGTGEFPVQMASYAENVSIWWRHHDVETSAGILMTKAVVKMIPRVTWHVITYPCCCFCYFSVHSFVNNMHHTFSELDYWNTIRTKYEFWLGLLKLRNLQFQITIVMPHT